MRFVLQRVGRRRGKIAYSELWNCAGPVHGKMIATMPKKTKAKPKTKIVAHLPASVTLSRRDAQNIVKIDVRIKGSKEGSLHIARGTVEWWPDYKKVNAHRRGWAKFVELLETMPRRRSKR